MRSLVFDLRFHKLRLIHSFSFIFGFLVERKFLFDSFKGRFDFSNILLDVDSRSCDIFKKSFFGRSELIVGKLDAVENFGILFSNISLDRLAETAPLIVSSMGSIG